MKSALKESVGRLFARRQMLGRRCYILAYHRVLPPELVVDEHPAMAVSSNDFDSQMAWLKTAFDIVPLRELISNDVAGRPRVAVTFDDGWRDTFEIAGPILKRWRVPSTVFLTTALIGSDDLFWWQKLDHLVSKFGHAETLRRLSEIIEKDQLTELRGWVDEAKGAGPGHDFSEMFKTYNGILVRRLLDTAFKDSTPGKCRAPTMTWANAAQLAGDGHTFGPHGRSHDILTVLSPGDAAREIEQSYRDILSRDLPCDPVFAFPNGNSDVDTRGAVARAGLTHALGMKKGSFDPANANHFDLPRINVGRHNAPTLARFKYLMLSAAFR